MTYHRSALRSSSALGALALGMAALALPSSVALAQSATPLPPVAVETTGDMTTPSKDSSLDGTNLLPGWTDNEGTTGVYRGANPPEGALLSFWVKEYTGDPVKITLARRLRRETTMPLKWICQRLEMGSWKSVNRRLYENRQTKC